MRDEEGNDERHRARAKLTSLPSEGRRAGRLGETTTVPAASRLARSSGTSVWTVSRPGGARHVGAICQACHSWELEALEKPKDEMRDRARTLWVWPPSEAWPLAGCLKERPHRIRRRRGAGRWTVVRVRPSTDTDSDTYASRAAVQWWAGGPGQRRTAGGSGLWHGTGSVMHECETGSIVRESTRRIRTRTRTRN